MTRYAILFLLVLMTGAFAFGGQESIAMEPASVSVSKSPAAVDVQVNTISDVTLDGCEGDCPAQATPDCVGSSHCAASGLIIAVPTLHEPMPLASAAGVGGLASVSEVPARIETPPPRIGA